MIVEFGPTGERGSHNVVDAVGQESKTKKIKDEIIN